jgi:hypothetical protein
VAVVVDARIWDSAPRTAVQVTPASSENSNRTNEAVPAVVADKLTCHLSGSVEMVAVGAPGVVGSVMLCVQPRVAHADH